MPPIRGQCDGKSLCSIAMLSSGTQNTRPEPRLGTPFAAMGDDALTGTKLLREVLRHAETPLDVKIQCAGLVLKQESPTAEQKECVVHMPPALPGDTPQTQIAVWWALYGGMGDMPAGADPEWDNAVQTLLRLIPTKKMPETLQ